MNTTTKMTVPPRLATQNQRDVCGDLAYRKDLDSDIRQAVKDIVDDPAFTWRQGVELYRFLTRQPDLPISGDDGSAAVQAIVEQQNLLAIASRLEDDGAKIDAEAHAHTGNGESPREAVETQ